MGGENSRKARKLFYKTCTSLEHKLKACLVGMNEDHLSTRRSLTKEEINRNRLSRQNKEEAAPETTHANIDTKIKLN